MTERRAKSIPRPIMWWKIKIVYCPIILEHAITTGRELDHNVRFKRRWEKEKTMRKERENPPYLSDNNLEKDPRYLTVT